MQSLRIILRSFSNSQPRLSYSFLMDVPFQAPVMILAAPYCTLSMLFARALLLLKLKGEILSIFVCDRLRHRSQNGGGHRVCKLLQEHKRGQTFLVATLILDPVWPWPA